MEIDLAGARGGERVERRMDGTKKTKRREVSFSDVSSTPTPHSKIFFFFFFFKRRHAAVPMRGCALESRRVEAHPDANDVGNSRMCTLRSRRSIPLPLSLLSRSHTATYAIARPPARTA